LGNELGILENTWYIQELQPNGDVYLRRFKDIKNRIAGSGYQANPADGSEDSGLDYQHEYDF
jgi:hypothetical protein